MQETGNVIVDLTFKFSLNILSFTDKLEQLKKFAAANQITKSGTSIGANVHESQAGQSKRGFLAKLKIAEKEVEETEYWLLLCKESEVLPDPGNLLSELQPIKKVLGKILSTCYKNGYDK